MNYQKLLERTKEVNSDFETLFISLPSISQETESNVFGERIKDIYELNSATYNTYSDIYINTELLIRAYDVESPLLRLLIKPSSFANFKVNTHEIQQLQTVLQKFLQVLELHL